MHQEGRPGIQSQHLVEIDPNSNRLECKKFHEQEIEWLVKEFVQMPKLKEPSRGLR